MVMPEADRGPLSVTPDAVRTDAWTPLADRTVAVIGPLDETEADRREPVKLPELATNAPATVAVREASAPITMPLAPAPRRSTPDVAPVPASRTRSPPVEALCPAA